MLLLCGVGGGFGVFWLGSWVGCFVGVLLFFFFERCFFVGLFFLKGKKKSTKCVCLLELVCISEK